MIIIIKSFNILVISLNILHYYFDVSNNILFSDKNLDTHTDLILYELYFSKTVLSM